MPRAPELQGSDRARRRSEAGRRRRKPPRASRRRRRGRRSRRSGSSSAAKPSERLTLDAPVLTSLDQRRAREAAAGRAVGDSRRAWCRRCSRSKIAASTTIPGVDPIGMVGAVFSNLRGTRALHRRRQHDHAAARRATSSCRQFDGHDAADGARAVAAAASCSSMWVSLVLTHARVEGRDPRDVPERRAARPARLVRDRRRRRRRRGCSSARTSATSRSPRRRRSPASSSRRRRCRRSTTRRAARNAATSCCRRWPTPATSRRTPPTRAQQRAARRRRSARSKPRRRTSSTTSARRSTSDYPGLTTTTDQAVDVYTTLDLHLQRLAQDAVRDGLTQRRPAAVAAQAQGQGGGGADRGRSADRRDPRVRRRPLVQPVAVQPRDRCRAGSRDRSSSRSSISRRSSRRPPTGAPTSRRRRSSTTSRTTFEFDDQVWTPENYEDEYDGPITFRRALAHSRNLAHDPRRASRPATTSRRAVEEASASATPPKAVSVDRARRVRSDAVRNRDRVHALPESAASMRPLQHIAADRRAAARTSRKKRRRRRRGDRAAATRPSSSRT